MKITFKEVIRRDVEKDLYMPTYIEKDIICSDFACRDRNGRHIDCSECMLERDNYNLLREQPYGLSDV